MADRARDIALEAAALVGGNRNEAHGDALQNHSIIAALWNGYMESMKVAGREQLTPEDAANLMECLKIARRLSGSYNPDDYVDGAGYAAIAGEIRAKLRD